MRNSGLLLGATALFVLGSVPQITRAQVPEYCVAAYTDFAVDTAQDEIEAWAWVADYFSGGFCGQLAYYQWGYWEHSYEAAVNIVSPTQRQAYDVDYWANVPYGGGSAEVFASLSYTDDYGGYVIEWLVRIFCSIGGYFVDYFDALYAEIEEPPCSGSEVAGYTASLLSGRSLSMATRYRIFLSDFENRIFRFQVTAYSPDVENSEDRDTIASEALKWDEDKSLCGEEYHSDITHAWSADINAVNARVTIVPNLSAWGRWVDEGCGYLTDCIMLHPDRDLDVYGHEIGHALGFLHSIVPIDVMCDENCTYGARDVQAWHIRKLLDKYGAYNFFP